MPKTLFGRGGTLKKIRRNNGFSTVFIVLIMTSLIFLILMAYEASAAKAASSYAENICLAAGRSVLSEYQPALNSEYGIFAVRARDDELSEIAAYYIDRSCEGRGVLGISRGSCEVSTEKYPGLSTDALSKQTVKLGTLCAAGELLSGADLISVFSGISEAEAANFQRASESLESLNGLKDYTDAEPAREDPETGKKIEEKPESQQAAETRKQARQLLREYRSATDPGGIADGGNGKYLDFGSIAALPSADLGIGKTLSPVLSGGLSEAGAEAVLTDEYILTVCSDALRPKSAGSLSFETEYILYGNAADKANSSAAKRAVFGIRFASDLAAVFADSAKMSELSSIAASAFSFIPLPVAVFILASIEAGIQAKEELAVILDGGTVPLLQSVPSFGSYRDYLRLLLLALDGDAKLARLMDIMQLEVRRLSGKEFTFRDYAYGFELNAVFEKPVRFSRFLGLGEKMNGEVYQIHIYR